MEAARKHLKEPPAFTREDGTSAEPNEVPADTRGKLESARHGFLSHIAPTLWNSAPTTTVPPATATERPNASLIAPWRVRAFSSHLNCDSEGVDLRP